MEKMKNQQPVMVSLPEKFKDMLHIIAAKRVIDDPKNRATAAGVAREIIIKELEDVYEEEFESWK